MISRKDWENYKKRVPEEDWEAHVLDQLQAYIYLVKSGKYYKVGYTKKPKDRFGVYKSHNPEGIEVIALSGLTDEAYDKEQIIINGLSRFKINTTDWMDITDVDAIIDTINIINRL